MAVLQLGCLLIMPTYSVNRVLASCTKQLLAQSHAIHSREIELGGNFPRAASKKYGGGGGEV